MRLTVLNVSYPLAPVSSGTPGGAEQVLSTLDQELVRAGHLSLVLASEKSKCQGLLLPMNCSSAIFHRQARWESRRRCRAAIETALEKFDVDIIHLHGLDFYSYLPDTSIPVVVTLHLPPDWYAQEIFRFHRPNVSLVCVSAAQARSCPSHAQIESIIPNGIDLQKFWPNDARANYALCLGRICPEKGFHLAMDACTAAGIPLLIAGAVFPYPEHQRYFEEKIRPRLKHGHHYLGIIGGRRKQQLLASAHCLIVPSQVEETSSLVAMEAAACGTPVLAFRRGALPEVIHDGHTGILVDDVAQMARALPRMSVIDPAACRAEAIRRFDGHRMAADYLSLYERLNGRHVRVTHLEEALHCA